MAHYLVRAKPLDLAVLRQKLDEEAFKGIRPFGEELDGCLRSAKITPDGWVTWEEVCFCTPPLAQERSVLDQHFTDLTTQQLAGGEGWQRIADLPDLWDNAAL